MQTQMQMDRLSPLPDHLLIRILSDLDVKEAATTSLLSKRWRFVCTDLPSLHFCEIGWEIEKVKRFKAGVHGALASRRGAALESFSLCFSYDKCLDSGVDIWVELATINKVQDLNLILYRNILHQRMGFSSLSIEFVDEEDELLEISAPYMTYLSVTLYPRTGSLRLTNVASLKKIKLWLTEREDDEDRPSFEMMNNEYQTFQNIRCFTSLVLVDDTLEVLSLMAGNGWEIPEFMVENMHIDVDDGELDIHSTILILESAPFLKSLTISGCPDQQVCTNWGPIARSELNRDLLHLKTIVIEGFTHEAT